MNYPSAIPLTDIQEIVRIIKDGTIATEKEQLAKHLWVVQGFAQYSLLGDPDTSSGLIGTVTPQSLPEVLPDLVSALEVIVAQAEVSPQALAIPPSWILKLVIAKIVEILVDYLQAQLI